jgi:hypothetical protein
MFNVKGSVNLNPNHPVKNYVEGGDNYCTCSHILADKKLGIHNRIIHAILESLFIHFVLYSVFYVKGSVNLNPNQTVKNYVEGEVISTVQCTCSHILADKKVRNS